MPEAATAETAPAQATDDWSHLYLLSCSLTVDLPLPEFRIVDWLALREQTVIDTRWRVGSDVPLRVNGQLLGWCEFETVGNHLAVRLTELA